MAFWDSWVQHGSGGQAGAPGAGVNYFDGAKGWNGQNGNVGNGTATTGHGLEKWLGLWHDPATANQPAAVDPAAGKIDTTQADASRAQQEQLIAMLQGRAAGTAGPSMAQGQLQNATDANIRQAMAVGASQPGQGYQSALRNILDTQAGIQQGAAGQSALLKNQEMQQATGQLSSLLGGTRGQDISQAGGVQNAALGYGQITSQNQNEANRAAAQREKDEIDRKYGLVSGLGQAAEGIAKLVHHGGEIEGEAAVSGDHPANDTVLGMLSPGEIVLPRSVTQSDDPEKNAAAFVRALRRRKKIHGRAGA